MKVMLRPLTSLFPNQRRNATDQNYLLCSSGGVDPLIRGLVGRQAKLNTQDNMMTDELRDRLFQFTQKLALDLASLNMQRARDHAIPGIYLLIELRFYLHTYRILHSQKSGNIFILHVIFRLQPMAQVLWAVTAQKFE